MEKTVVLGASPNPRRFSYKAVRRLKNNGYTVVPVGFRKGDIEGVTIQTGMPEMNSVDTVALYMGAARQKEYYDYILKLKPRRIIFNPGTENDELYDLCDEHDIEALEDCVLVMLNSGVY